MNNHSPAKLRLALVAVALQLISFIAVVEANLYPPHSVMLTIIGSLVFGFAAMGLVVLASTND